MPAALRHEVSDVIFGDWELQIVREYLLEVSGVDLVFVSLIEKLEALSGLVIFS